MLILCVEVSKGRVAIFRKIKQNNNIKGHPCNIWVPGGDKEGSPPLAQPLPRKWTRADILKPC